MKEILDKYCSQEIGETGLFLFNPPTGSGKTYRVLEYIFHNYMTFCKDGRKIFFVTNLKKNLPYEELRSDFFEKNNKLADYEKDVLFIDSNMDFVIKELLNVEDEIDPYFKTPDFWNLRKLVKSIRRLESNSKDTDVIDEFKRQIREQYEPAFRKRITDYLKKNYNTKRDRIQAIKKKDPRLKWIGILYPTVFTDQRKIFFLSIDKFFAQNSTLVEPSYFFHENRITAKGLIFIDEIDATKENILSNIIESGLNQKIDYVKLFNSINNALLNNVFPTNVLRMSSGLEEQKKENPKIHSPQEIIQSFRDIANNLEKEYKLRVSFKIANPIGGNRKRNLLFHDFRYHTVLKDGKKFIKVQYSNKDQVNSIVFTDEKVDNPRHSIIILLSRLKGFFTYFQNGIRKLSENYYELKNNEGRNTEYTFESALHSILEEFQLEARHKFFIIENILSERNVYRKLEDRLNFDLSVYQNGYRYFDFVDDDEHDTLTKAFIFSFQNSPEKFILKLAEKAKVVGISATAKMETVTGNYDINYLSNQLGDNYYELTKEEQVSIRKEYENQYPDYNTKINIHTEWVETDSKSTDFEKWKLLFDSEELAHDYLNRLNTKDFFKNRYYRVGYVYKQFLIHDDIVGFLCLLTAFPRRGFSDFDENLLLHLFDLLIKVTGKQEHFTNEDRYSPADSYIIIRSKEFDIQKEGLLSKLEEGKKVFILSTYQTIGAGQNLHFKAHSLEGLVKFHNQSGFDWNTENKTDINAIYLDKPTHLIVNANSKSLKEYEFAKYLFQLEFLQDHGDISMSQLYNEVKFAFENLTTSVYSDLKVERSFNMDSLYEQNNFSQHVAKVVIQGIGRLCRTNLKSSNIYIFADKAIYPHMEQVDEDDQTLLWEVKKLKDTIPEAYKKLKEVDPDNLLLNRAITTSRKAKAEIDRLLKSDWSERSMNIWNRLREMVLHFPVLTLEEARTHSRICQLYVEIPDCGCSYSYDKRGDFDDVLVSFTDDLKFKVSEKSCRLDRLMEIPGVHTHFTRHSWATTFKDGRYILSPQLFNNIYKGALGEVVGKIILDEQLNIPLFEIESKDAFEKFDFTLGNDVYVDFKHWYEGSIFSADEEQKKIREKMDLVGAEKVYVINIMANRDYKVITSPDGRIIEIPNLWNTGSNEFNIGAMEALAKED